MSRSPIEDPPDALASSAAPITPTGPARASAPTRLCIGWDSTHLAWRLDGEAGAPPRLQALHDARHWRPSLPESLREVHVIASPRVAVHWTQVPPEGLRSMDELRHAAAARCALLFGGVAGDWWLAADWQASRPFVCAALNRARMAPLQHALRERPLQWHWHSAAMLFAQSPPAPPAGWVAVRSPRRLLLWHQFEGRPDAALSWPIAPDATAQQAQALVKEGQLRLRLAQRHSPEDVRWLVGPGPEGLGEEAEAALNAWQWFR